MVLELKTTGIQLIGKTFCITGTLSKPRRVIESEIKEAGGSIASKVSSRTSYLISNEKSNSSKMQEALALKVPIITESEFFNLIGK